MVVEELIDIHAKKNVVSFLLDISTLGIAFMENPNDLVAKVPKNFQCKENVKRNSRCLAFKAALANNVRHSIDSESIKFPEYIAFSYFQIK